MPSIFIEEVPILHLNISPTQFRIYAAQYFDCYQSFKPETPFSPVPYFLLCRSIELTLKAEHLEAKSRKQVKTEFGHNLARLYTALPPLKKTLDTEEVLELTVASTIYDIPNKGFEYVSVYDAVTHLKAFPKLEVLERIADKLLKTEA